MAVEDVSKIVDMVRERKWDMLIVLGLITLLGLTFAGLAITVPRALTNEVNETITENMVNITASIVDIQEDISEINERDFNQIQNSGLAAYKKFEGLRGDELIDKLKSSTQNAYAAKTALSDPGIYEILSLVDRELTLEISAYFEIEN